MHAAHTAATRRTVSLDGEWLLTVLDRPDVEHRVQVPGPWTTQVPGHGDSHATARYHRTVDLDPAVVGGAQRAYLTFGGVNHTADVRVNGIHVGSHDGGWTPFECDVTGILRAGANTVDVTVGYPPLLGSATQASQGEVPHGKQSWYGTTAGIWQPVALELRPAVHLAQVQVRPDAHATGFEVTVTLSSAEDTVGLAVLASVDYAGTQVAAAHTTAPTSARGSASTDTGPTVQLTLPVPAPHRWDVDEPHLYTVTVDLVRDRTVLDRQEVTTGLRTFEARDGSFFLNGEEIEIRAVLDQDYHPGSSSVPATTAELEALFRQVRALGFNMIRCHIKRPDARYYELADRLGLLVWAELPSWLTMTPGAAVRGSALLEEILELDAHHPSIVIWTVMNESWGIDLTSATQRSWLKATFERTKELVPHAVVVDNSACEPNFHVKSDVEDFHVYRGIPESRREWDAKVAELAARPDWTFSPYGDAERRGDEPVMLSEFGNWGLPWALDQYGPDGAEPWWFALGADWAFGAADATGLMRRFHEGPLREVFGSWDALVRALQRVQLIANRYQTGTIRSSGLAGYVLTQLCDVQWEANGLLDANRRPKEYTEEFALVNGDTAVVLRPSAYSVVAGGVVAAEVVLVPPRPATGYAGRSVEVRVSVDGVVMSSYPVSLTGRAGRTVEVTIDAHGQHELAAELWIDGALAARDACDILGVDLRPVADVGPVLHADAACGQWLAALGIESQPLTPAAADGLLVARVFGATAQAFARRGGAVLVLAEDAGALGNAFDYLPSARLGPRTGDGDWVPRNEWLHRTGHFAAVPGDPILGIAFEDLLGDLVLNGIPHPMRPARVYSGIFSGWLRGQATSTATVRWSAGTVTLTTLRLRDQAGRTPIADALGRAMVQQAAAGL